MSELVSPEQEQYILNELREPTEQLIHRHQSNAKMWYPHEVVPWDQARDFESGEVWDPGDLPLPEAVRSALFVGLLTEDNLPYYTETIRRVSGKGHPLYEEWTPQWTYEEGRHSMAMRDWVVATRALDPIELEQARKAQVTGATVPQPEDVVDTLVYVSLQEPATQISHSNTGRFLPKESGGKKVMGFLAGDETLHYVFYRDLAKAGFAVDPSAFMITTLKQIRKFQMPGTGIPDFEHHKKLIRLHGIYGVTEFVNNVIAPTLEAWNIENMDGLSDKAKQARDGIYKTLGTLGDMATREQKLREEYQANLAA